MLIKAWRDFETARSAATGEPPFNMSDWGGENLRGSTSTLPGQINPLKN